MQDHGVASTDWLVVDDSFWGPSSSNVEAQLPVSPVLFDEGQVTVIANTGTEDRAGVFLSLAEDDAVASCVRLDNQAHLGEEDAINSLTFTPVPGSNRVRYCWSVSLGHS